ncbi:hypothetical protein JNL27_00770 [bacterium]|nr:hypothetical protein [bacterium]
MKKTLTGLLLILALASCESVWAQDESLPDEFSEMTETSENTTGIGGIVDAVTTFGNKPHLNANTLNDNNFNNIRALLNFRFQHKEKLRADVEVLFDDASAEKVRLQGAFITIFDVPNEKINFMIGKIPNLFGNFGKREFSDVNPLIGQPLMRQYRTSLDWNNLWNNQEQLILKNRRKAHKGNLPVNVLAGATPTVYDARWDFGVELFGNISFVDYQIAVTEGSISNPDANQNKGKQFLGRLGFAPVAGLKFGFSGASNPYLSSADPQRLLEEGKGKGEYRQMAYGMDLEASYRYLIVFSEFVKSTWDASVDEGELSNWSWYVDAKYKLHPKLYAAGRYDMMNFSKIKNPATAAKESWDYDVKRYEAGLGFRITADATLKLVEQWTVFDKKSSIKNVRFTAAQLSVPF